MPVSGGAVAARTGRCTETSAALDAWAAGPTRVKGPALGLIAGPALRTPHGSLERAESTAAGPVSTVILKLGLIAGPPARTPYGDALEPLAGLVLRAPYASSARPADRQ
eukprot:9552806-Alexandrium_andersonii.AAC.1